MRFYIYTVNYTDIMWLKYDSLNKQLKTAAIHIFISIFSFFFFLSETKQYIHCGLH